MNDIFVDADSATNFPGPTNESFGRFVQWLYEYDQNNPNLNAHLIVSQKLLVDYFAGCKNTTCKNSIASIYNYLNNQNRIIQKSTQEINQFIKQYFTKSVWDSLRCKRPGSNDPYHLALIFLSNRKIALSQDNDLLYDLTNVKLKKIRNTIIASNNPDELPYR